MWKVNGKTWYSEDEMNRIKNTCNHKIKEFENSKYPHYRGAATMAKIILNTIKDIEE